jgi:hypothetical protein
MKDCKPASDTRGIEEGLRSLLNAQLLLGKELIKLAGGAGSGLAGLRNLKLPKGHSCCEVPEPCWMPLSLGELRCQLRPGDAGTVCLVVTNEDFRPHVYQFAATGKDAASVSFSATQATLGPKERIAVTATFTVPKDGQRLEDCRCIDREALVWVRGCRNHYLRWSIDEMASAKPCCREIEVRDEPDYVLHWYDHFHMLRNCPGGPLQPAPVPVPVPVPGVVAGAPR